MTIKENTRRHWLWRMHDDRTIPARGISFRRTWPLLLSFTRRINEATERRATIDNESSNSSHATNAIHHGSDAQLLEYII
jgi:hypothetical protein